MAQIFPEWTNRIPFFLVIFVFFTAIFAVGFVWYYFSPEYTDVGYRPEQPVAFSHKIHAGEVGLDCRFCHSAVEISANSNIPPTQTCMNCHKEILPTSTKLDIVRNSFAEKKPLQWIRVHNLPDYVYFDHSAHLYTGIGCASCHGKIDRMEVVIQTQPLSMGWCLKCHKAPEEHLRPKTEITNMWWKNNPENKKFAQKQIKEKNITPPTDCWGCHR